MALVRTSQLCSKGRLETYSLSNDSGLQVEIINLGASIRRFLVPDKNGDLRDIVLGYEQAQDYFQNTETFFGSTVGRSAGRLAGGRFSLHGKTYQLRQNQGENNLHSGPNGYQIRLFQLVPEETSETQLTLSLESPDGDQGYPGNLTFSVSFELNQTNELTITYKAISDQDTLFNVTNHSYFNLNGHESGSIEAHSLQLKAKTFTPLENEAAIPSGEIREVTGSAFDFQEAKPIGRDINAKEQQILYAGGYDHNWILTEPSLLKPFARAIGDQTGIQLEVFTDLPGVQVYTGNFIDNEKGKDGTIYGKRAGFCLETQFYPNAVNFPHFPSPIIKANQEVRHKTKYRLSLREL